MRISRYWTACFLAMLPMLCASALSQSTPHARQIDVDDAANEETLNREIWETMKGLPYTEAKVHAARRQKDGLQRDATVALPTG